MSAKRPIKDKTFDKFSGGRYLDAIAYIRVGESKRRLTVTEAAVLRAIAAHMNVSNMLGSSWNLSHEDIAASALCDPRTSMRTAKTLLQYGLIKCDQRRLGCYQGKNKYQLTKKVFEAYEQAFQGDSVSPSNASQGDSVSPSSEVQGDSVSPSEVSRVTACHLQGDSVSPPGRQPVTRSPMSPIENPIIYTAQSSPQPTKPKANLRSVLTDVAKATDEVLRVFRPRGREFFPVKEWEGETRRLCASYSIEDFRMMASYLIAAGLSNQPGLVAADLETYIKASKGEVELPYTKGKNEVQHISPKAPSNLRIPESACGIDWIASMSDLSEVEEWLARLKAGALAQTPATMQALRVRFKELAGKEYA